jgi:hypothetical protein
MRGPQSATTTAAPPSSVMKSRRFSRPNCMRRPSQGNPRQHNALASISQGLAAVRISIRPMSAQGHDRSFGDVGSMSGLPLKS